MSPQDILTLTLAAGKSSRMKSQYPKIMHSLGGRPLIGYVLDTVKALNPKKSVLVLAPGMQDIANYATMIHEHEIVYQDKQLGTGHAVLAAREHLKEWRGHVLVLFGDTPLITLKTINRALAELEKSSIVLLGMRPENQHHYARIVINNEQKVEAIIEKKDATPDQLKIPLCNSGVMAIKGPQALPLLQKIQNNNSAGEFYLTDIIEIARAQDLTITCLEADAEELCGINTRQELTAAESNLQKIWRGRAMTDGATLTDPQSVFFSFDTQVGNDVIIGPNVIFGPEVSIGNNVEIRPFCKLEGVTIDEGAVIGPFAHIRPGTQLASNVRIGNFVELKNASLSEGAKVNHLSYIGDSDIGRETNIGAGTITCNYDGFRKSKTTIGDNVLIGSNTSLIAPVMVGNNAIVGAGSVITKDVSADAIAMERTAQTEISGGSKRYRTKHLRTLK